MFVVVPNELSEKIYAKVDEMLKPFPQLKENRDEIYGQILAYYDKHGTIPDFKIEPVKEEK